MAPNLLARREDARRPRQRLLKKRTSRQSRAEHRDRIGSPFLSVTCRFHTHHPCFAFSPRHTRRPNVGRRPARGLENPRSDSNERTCTMNVTISAWQQSATCIWCQKDDEAVTVTFESGFLRDSDLCWKCLKQALRVHHQQQHADPKRKSESPRGASS